MLQVGHLLPPLPMSNRTAPLSSQAIYMNAGPLAAAAASIRDAMGEPCVSASVSFRSIDPRDGLSRGRWMMADEPVVLAVLGSKSINPCRPASAFASIARPSGPPL